MPYLNRLTAFRPQPSFYRTNVFVYKDTDEDVTNVYTTLKPLGAIRKQVMIIDAGRHFCRLFLLLLLVKLFNYGLVYLFQNLRSAP